VLDSQGSKKKKKKKKFGGGVWGPGVGSSMTNAQIGLVGVVVFQGTKKKKKKKKKFVAG
jgi:ABC-type glycerol-3-phosphate transport system substrate-binding protein